MRTFNKVLSDKRSHNQLFVRRVQDIGYPSVTCCQIISAMLVDVARRMYLYWASRRFTVTSYNSRLKRYWHSYSSGGQRRQVLTPGSKVIIVGHTNWLGETHDLMMAHVVP